MIPFCHGQKSSKVKAGFFYLSRGPEETRHLASALSRYSFPGLVILLSGTLGAGKTEFVRGFASGSGWGDVRSPSFTIINEYLASTPITQLTCTGLRGTLRRSSPWKNFPVRDP